MYWKVRLKHLIPTGILNRTLLSFPALYRTSLVKYESNLVMNNGLKDLHRALEKAVQLPGDVIECGSSRCGTSIIIAEYLRARGVRKSVYALDSFVGFPLEELHRERDKGWNSAPDSAFTSTSWEYVNKKIAALGYADTVVPVKGFFQDTLRALRGPFCLALIDCDLRDSLMFCARELWPRLVDSGTMLFDDYLSPVHRGARLGVDQFVQEYGSEIAAHKLLNRLYRVDKPANGNFATG